MADTLLSRFLRYVKIDTQSKEGVEGRYPSTAKQLDLSRLLLKELKALGVKSARMDKYGYVMASIPSNLPGGKKAAKAPAVGLIAHVDTSEACSGANVKPKVIEYKGGDIVLAGDSSVVLKEKEDPELRKCKGKTIVVTDGTTLLGADDKAGVAIIMTVVEKLMKDPSFLHGEVKVAFTPDEEVGAGTDHFDIKAFGAQVAYTLDGEQAGELNKETFSADSATVTIHGKEVHPGTAKNVMVNSIRAAADIIARTPKDKAPETTEGYEQYMHPYVVEATPGKTVIKFLFRDFKTEGLAGLKRMLEGILAEVRPLHPKARIELAVSESYRNMREALEKDPRVLDNLWEAVKRAGLEPRWVPIRGGTDGSRLTADGLPTPNIFIGGVNSHSKSEWLCVDTMQKSYETVLHLLQIWAGK